MQHKFEKFNELRPELKIETAQNLSNRDLVSLAQTSKYYLSLFKPLIDVRKLLHHVVRGKYDAVQLILKDDMSLMLKRGKVTDCSGREFESISPFEYALWALDKHMWARMIACIPGNEEGRKIFGQLIIQYNKAQTNGVTYRLHGNMITENHFDFENTLIKELKIQVDLIDAPRDKNWDAIDKQWQKGVGGAQKLLPMHVVYEYCSDEPFYPIPKFTSQPVSSQQFYNWTTNEEKENWFNAESKLGSGFAIYKGDADAWASGCGLSRGSGCTILDLDAIKALYEVRKTDFINLKLQLDEGVSLNNDHQVVPMLPS